MGLEKFVEIENQRWLCPVCGGMLCVHRNFCLNCKKIKMIQENSTMKSLE